MIKSIIMKNLIRKNILNFKPYKPGKPLSEIKRELGLKKIIKLASNENFLGTSPKAKKAIKGALNEICRYPDGNCFYLKKKLSERLKLEPENIIFGNGSNEIIELIIKTFLNEDEEVIMSRPDFLIFKLAVLQENALPVEVGLKDFRCNLEGIKKAINKKTKIIFIANPNNPVGTYVKKNELTQFISDIPDNIVIALDEAYYEFAEDADDFPDSLQFLSRKNVIILRTFSKVYGLSGLRLGYGLANKEAINYLNNSRQPFNVNHLAQVAGLAALDDEKFLKKTLRDTKKGKAYLYQELAGLGLNYIASATNFVLVELKRGGRDVFERLLKVGVIVRDMAAYGMSTWIRVTVGTPGENKRFIFELGKVLKGE